MLGRTAGALAANLLSAHDGDVQDIRYLQTTLKALGEGMTSQRFRDRHAPVRPPGDGEQQGPRTGGNHGQQQGSQGRKVPPWQETGSLGYPTFSDDEATAYVKRAFANNGQIQAHVIGDAFIDQFIQAVRGAEAAYGKTDRRPVAIHTQTGRKDSGGRVPGARHRPLLLPDAHRLLG